MKLKSTLVVITLLMSLCCVGVASAQSASTAEIRSAVQSAIGTGNVTALVKNGTVTLVGNVDSSLDANKAESAVWNFDGIDCVHNHISVNN